MKQHFNLKCKKILCVLVIILGAAFTATVHAAEKPKVIIGDDINYPPYSFIDENGNPAGFNVELAKEAAEAMGYTVEIRLDEWSKTRKALEDGEIDVISGMFYTKQRESLYSFTVNHTITNSDIFTRKETQLSGIDGLKGKTVVVQAGDITEEYLRSLDLGIRIVEAPTVNEALKLVQQGKYDYAGLLKLPGLYSIRQQNIRNMKPQELVLIPNDYCMAVKKGNETMQMMLNGGLGILKANGEYQRIYDKWLGIYEDTSVSVIMKKYKWVILLSCLSLVAFAVISLLLKRMVNKKTEELRNANNDLEKEHHELEMAHQELKANMDQILAMEMTLHEQYDSLELSQQQLKISEENNKAIIHALPDILFIIDGEGTFLDCKVNDEGLLMMPKSEFIGRNIMDILPERIAEGGYKSIREALSTGKLQRYEYEFKINGERQIFEMRIIRSRENEVVCIARNISSDVIYLERIEFLSYHDQLTGLYNRRFFEEELKRLDVKRNLPLCIIMGDVNGLKLINDSFGHENGDKLLLKVAGTLRMACRSDEIIARIGGDEFVILIANIKDLDAETLIDRINVISKDEKIEGIDLSITFGWEIKYHENQDISELLKKAEDNMYKKKLFESPSVRSKTIGAIMHTLHEKNKREEQHCVRVSDLSRQLAIALGLPDAEVEVIKSMGLLHDIGKIGISEEILNSDKILTNEEFEEIKRHPEVGYRILSSVNDMKEMAEYVLYHHEYWNGTGYPRGLKGEEIPLQSRIICITDAFDAITSDRSYRKGKSVDYAIKELVKCAGTQFDPELVRIFIDKVIVSCDRSSEL